MTENLKRISVRLPDEQLEFLQQQAEAKMRKGLKSDVSDQLRISVTRYQLASLEPWQREEVCRRLKLGAEKGGDPEAAPDEQLIL